MSMIISAMPVTTPVQATIKTASEAPTTKPMDTVATPVDTFEKTEAKTPASRNGIKVVIPTEIFEQQGVKEIVPTLTNMVKASQQYAKEQTLLGYTGDEIVHIVEDHHAATVGIDVLNLIAHTIRNKTSNDSSIDSGFKEDIILYEQLRDGALMRSLQKLGVNPTDSRIQLTRSAEHTIGDFSKSPSVQTFQQSLFVPKEEPQYMARI